MFSKHVEIDLSELSPVPKELPSLLQGFIANIYNVKYKSKLLGKKKQVYDEIRNQILFLHEDKKNKQIIHKNSYPNGFDALMQFIERSIISSKTKTKLQIDILKWLKDNKPVLYKSHEDIQTWVGVYKDDLHPPCCTFWCCSFSKESREKPEDKGTYVPPKDVTGKTSNGKGRVIATGKTTSYRQLG